MRSRSPLPNPRQHASAQISGTPATSAPRQNTANSAQPPNQHPVITTSSRCQHNASTKPAPRQNRVGAAAAPRQHTHPSSTRTCGSKATISAMYLPVCRQQQPPNAGFTTPANSTPPLARTNPRSLHEACVWWRARGACERASVRACVRASERGVCACGRAGGRAVKLKACCRPAKSKGHVLVELLVGAAVRGVHLDALARQRSRDLVVGGKRVAALRTASGGARHTASVSAPPLPRWVQDGMAGMGDGRKGLAGAAPQPCAVCTLAATSGSTCRICASARRTT